MEVHKRNSLSNKPNNVNIICAYGICHEVKCSSKRMAGRHIYCGIKWLLFFDTEGMTQQSKAISFFI